MTPLHQLTGLPPDRPVIVAELSNAHNGNEDNAHRLIRAYKLAGADCIKFQAYTADDLVALRGDGPAPEPWGSQGWTMRRLYDKARTPLDWFYYLVLTCEEEGIPWFASVFGPESLAIMEELECPVYKLAALDAKQDVWTDTVRATGKPLIRSWPLGYAPDDGDTWLYCPPGYPQEHIVLTGLGSRGFHGFSYHGVDTLIPAKAVEQGARIIEVHVQLDYPPSELESHISYHPAEFLAMATAARAVC